MVDAPDESPGLRELLLDSFDLVALFLAGLVATVLGFVSSEWFAGFGALFASVLAVALFRVRVRLDRAIRLMSRVVSRTEVLEELLLDPDAARKNDAARRRTWGQEGDFGAGSGA